MINFIDVFCKDYTHYSQISFKCREIKENKSQLEREAEGQGKGEVYAIKLP